MTLKSILTTLALSLAVLCPVMADNIATNTVLDLITNPQQKETKLFSFGLQPVLANAEGWWEKLTAVGAITSVGEVYTAMGDGKYGGGFAGVLGLGRLDVKERTRFTLGPALVSASGDYGNRFLLEVSISTRVIDPVKFEKHCANLWLVGWMFIDPDAVRPGGFIDASDMSFYFGAGPRVDARTDTFNHFLNDSGVSVGLNGIRFGRGKD